MRAGGDTWGGRRRLGVEGARWQHDSAADQVTDCRVRAAPPEGGRLPSGTASVFWGHEKAGGGPCRSVF